MTRKYLTILFVMTITLVSAQIKIVNKLTADYQNVEGTKISLIPPAGFTKGVNFLGFQEEASGSSIMVLNIPGPFSETSKGITKENLLSTGVQMISDDHILLNGLPALLVQGKQSAYGNIYTKYILIFGTEKETIMINGVFPEHLTKLSGDIKKCLLSAYYEAEKKVNILETVEYTIEVSGTKLKFAGNMSNALLYTVDGELPSKSDDKTSLIISKSFSNANTEDLKDFSINRLKQTPFEVDSIKRSADIAIGDLSGYEIISKGKNIKTGVPEYLYQLILPTDSNYYILFGTTNDMSEVSISEIKKAAETFKLK